MKKRQSLAETLAEETLNKSVVTPGGTKLNEGYSLGRFLYSHRWMNGHTVTLSEFVDLFFGSACCSCQLLLVRVAWHANPLRKRRNK